MSRAPMQIPMLPAVRFEFHGVLFATAFASAGLLQSDLVSVFGYFAVSASACSTTEATTGRRRESRCGNQGATKSRTEPRPSTCRKARRASNRSLAAACMSAGRLDHLRKPVKYLSPAAATHFVVSFVIFIHVSCFCRRSHCREEEPALPRQVLISIAKKDGTRHTVSIPRQASWRRCKILQGAKTHQPTTGTRW